MVIILVLKYRGEFNHFYEKTEVIMTI